MVINNLNIETPRFARMCFKNRNMHTVSSEEIFNEPLVKKLSVSLKVAFKTE